MNKLCPMPGCRVEQITRDDPGLLSITAQGTRPGGRCPDCGHASRAVHSRYRRRPADLPSLGRAVRLDLRLRRFYCRNAACTRRTFAERLPELIRPHARRTSRLAEAQARVGAALGGEGSARLLQHLAMPASADTVLRLVRSLPLPEPEPPRVVGVDDWALRKGRTYGTIVVDLDRRRVLDLLPDRTAETLADWLRGHRRSRWWPATARPNTPAASGWGRRERPKWRTAGMCWSTCAKRSSDGWPGCMRGCGACRSVPARPPTRNRRGGPKPLRAPAPRGRPGLGGGSGGWRSMRKLGSGTPLVRSWKRLAGR